MPATGSEDPFKGSKDPSCNQRPCLSSAASETAFTTRSGKRSGADACSAGDWMRCAMLSWIIRQLSFVERCPLPSSSLSFAAAPTPTPTLHCRSALSSKLIKLVKDSYLSLKMSWPTYNGAQPGRRRHCSLSQTLPRPSASTSHNSTCTPLGRCGRTAPSRPSLRMSPTRQTSHSKVGPASFRADRPRLSRTRSTAECPPRATPPLWG